MTLKLTMLAKSAIVALVVGLFIWTGAQWSASWASTDQDPERQTVPTRTFTPAPVTPTTPPPTNTPLLPTDTPSPLPSATNTLAPTALATGTPAWPTSSVTPTPTNTQPNLLPVSGSGSWFVTVGVMLLLGGALVLLTGIRALEHRH